MKPFRGRFGIAPSCRLKLPDLLLGDPVEFAKLPVTSIFPLVFMLESCADLVKPARNIFGCTFDSFLDFIESLCIFHGRLCESLIHLVEPVRIVLQTLCMSVFHILIQPIQFLVDMLFPVFIFNPTKIFLDISNFSLKDPHFPANRGVAKTLNTKVVPKRVDRILNSTLSILEITQSVVDIQVSFTNSTETVRGLRHEGTGHVRVRSEFGGHQRIFAVIVIEVYTNRVRIGTWRSDRLVRTGAGRPRIGGARAAGRGRDWRLQRRRKGSIWDWSFIGLAQAQARAIIRIARATNSRSGDCFPFICQYLITKRPFGFAQLTTCGRGERSMLNGSHKPCRACSDDCHFRLVSLAVFGFIIGKWWQLGRRRYLSFLFLLSDNLPLSRSFISFSFLPLRLLLLILLILLILLLLLCIFIRSLSSSVLFCILESPIFIRSLSSSFLFCILESPIFIRSLSSSFLFCILESPLVSRTSLLLLWDFGTHSST
ncbi:hypothetical protein E6O75_ATG10024 [Venturia nashicola]|uniref:Uncharacterized protein n=1 Tax=Venturia nashicola TaxID=86259 RepID=A0A4Z1NZE9_9PEZI|nr:hypothetical protein E6O75_ATG10024 [Venturia nashicola]